MAEITDSKGAKHTLTFLHGEPLGSGLEGAVYRATLDGAPIAAKQIKLTNKPVKNRALLQVLAYQLSVEIELVNTLQVCRIPQGITCFRGIVADKQIFDFILEQIPDIGISALQYENPGSGSIYLLYELLEGKELLDYIKAGLLKPVQKISIIKQLLTILDRLHSNDIIHGDIKAENLFYNESDQLKLFDFGFTCKKTQCTTLRGTPGYISPERFSKGSLADPSKMDIFAAGQLIYVLCAQAIYIIYAASIEEDANFLKKIEEATKSIDVYLTKGHMRTHFLNFNEFHEDLYDKLFLPMIRQDPTKRPSASEALAILEGLERAGTLYKSGVAVHEEFRAPPLIRLPSTQYGGKRSQRSTRRQNKKRRSKKAA